MKQARIRLFFLVLPVLVLALWMLQLLSQRSHGFEVTLPVEGYDPLDHLSGHYVTYRLALGQTDPCRSSEDPLNDRSQPQCLCFSEDAPPRSSWSGSCLQKPAVCRYFLRGACSGSRFTADVERFYIPEADSPWLVTVPRHSTIVLSLGDSGEGIVKEFRPEGEDYASWIKKQKDEHPKAP